MWVINEASMGTVPQQSLSPLTVPFEIFLFYILILYMTLEFFEKIFKQKFESRQRLPDDEADKIISEKIDIDSLSKKLIIDFQGKQEEIIKSFARLALELKNKMAGYDTILSDDVSGRLVSLFLKDLIDRKRAEKNRSLSKIYFLPGQISLGIPDEQLEKFIENKKYQIRRALLSTEYIGSGITMKTFVDLLEDAGINFDIAALSLIKDPEYYDPRISTRLIYGGINKAGLVFYGADFMGVEKKISDENPLFGRLVLDKTAIPKNIKNARQDIKTLASELWPLVL